MKYLIFVIALLTACTQAPVKETREKPENVTVAARWDGKHPDAAKWSDHLYKAILSSELVNLKPGDISDFCPSYPTDKDARARFWVALISAMAEKESSHKPETQYKESFKDQHGNYVISRGLLQLSIESARGYKCVLDNAQDLHDPYKNLDCGLKILTRWVSKDGFIARKTSGWRGGARYWSVLRKSSTKSFITGYTKQVCK